MEQYTIDPCESVEQENNQWCTHSITVDLKTACMGYDPVLTTKPSYPELPSPPSHLENIPTTSKSATRQKELVRNSQIGICSLLSKSKKLHREKNS
jgi:hypothetical protein